MSIFSDKEDKMLIQLVQREEARNKSRISWIQIAEKMKSKKRPEQLRLRVKKLKQRFGIDFSKCPAWYRNKGRKKPVSTSKAPAFISVRKETQTESNDEISYEVTDISNMEAWPIEPATTSTKKEEEQQEQQQEEEQECTTTVTTTTSSSTTTTISNDQYQKPLVGGILAMFNAIFDDKKASTLPQIESVIERAPIEKITWKPRWSLPAIFENKKVPTLPQIDELIERAPIDNVTWKPRWSLPAIFNNKKVPTLPQIDELIERVPIDNVVSKPRRNALRRRTKQLIPSKLTANILLPSKLTTIQSHIAVSNVFATVKKGDIRQASGKTENNAGELTPLSTSDLIKVCELGESDVFIDIGSGVGNVVAQVALETFVPTVIGVEIRSDLAHLGKLLMKEQTSKYPGLQKIKIFPQDICSVDIVNEEMFQGITVLYCHNTLFKTDVLHVVENICCRLPCLRTVVIQLAFCPRHRDGCLREFCLLFKKRPTLFSTNVTYTATQVQLQVYDRIH